MAWTIWVDVGPADYMKITYMAQIAENQQIAADKVAAYFHRAVPLLPVDASRGEATQPFPAYLNRVEENIRRLYAALTWQPPGGDARTWLGEGMDGPTFRYSDVNRWFRDAEAVKITVEYAKKPRLASGAFSSGGARAQQMIRRR